MVELVLVIVYNIIITGLLLICLAGLVGHFMGMNDPLRPGHPNRPYRNVWEMEGWRCVLRVFPFEVPAPPTPTGVDDHAIAREVKAERIKTKSGFTVKVPKPKAPEPEGPSNPYMKPGWDDEEPHAAADIEAPLSPVSPATPRRSMDLAEPAVKGPEEEAAASSPGGSSDVSLVEEEMPKGVSADTSRARNLDEMLDPQAAAKAAADATRAAADAGLDAAKQAAQAARDTAEAAASAFFSAMPGTGFFGGGEDTSRAPSQTASSDFVGKGSSI